MKSLAVGSISARGFRNFERLETALGPRFNVLSGDNGQGKTNFLEAVYVALTSKSFRTHKAAELEALGHEEGSTASIRATIIEDGESRVQVVAVRAGRREVRIDDKRPPSLAAFAVRSPVVVFHPKEMELSMGGSAERRRMLDRVALYTEPLADDALDKYTQAMRSRQRVLETRGISAADLTEWESLMAEHGASLMEQRRRACAKIGEHASRVFGVIGSPHVALTIEFAPGARESREEFLRELFELRAADMRRGSANRGPHRDDMRVLLGESSARGVASQGQHRAIVLALKSAEIDVIASARGVLPILLLDDVSSELDRDRTSALFSFLRERQGQVLLTTTRPELIDVGVGAERVDFAVCAGVIEKSARA